MQKKGLILIYDLMLAAAEEEERKKERKIRCRKFFLVKTPTVGAL
jgi:hypothetical protein